LSTPTPAEPPQVFVERNLPDADAAIGYLNEQLDKEGDIIQVVVIKEGHVYRGELTVPAPPLPAAPPAPGS
jgi:hypothetical protein